MTFHDYFAAMMTAMILGLAAISQETGLSGMTGAIFFVLGMYYGVRALTTADRRKS